MAEFSLLWSFNSEKAARDCLALLTAGDNINEANTRVAYNADDKGWELSIRAFDARALAWFRGFACAFVRMTPGECESELGYSPAGESAREVAS